MRRLLVAGDDTLTTKEMIGRARRVAEQLDDGHSNEIVLVTDDSAFTRRWAALAAPELRRVAVARTASVGERLDAGLMLRPLPDELLVIGSDPGSTAAELRGLAQVLALSPQLAMATLAFPVDAESIACRGAAVRVGTVLKIGGFDRPLPVADRLEDLGADVAVCPTAPEISETAHRPLAALAW